MYTKLLAVIQLQVFAILVLPVMAASNSNTSLSYGHISAIEVTTEKSVIARNSILGGLAGIAIGDNTASAFQGAAAAFAITSIMEGDRRVFLYTVTLLKGGSKNIALHHPGLSVGECVAVEQGVKHTNLRPVSSVYCQSPDHKGLSSTSVVDLQQSTANACHDATEAVHAAKKDDDIDRALIQMRALCE